MCYKFIPNELYCILNSAFSILINLTIIDHDLSGKTMGNSIIKCITACLKFMYRKKECLKFTERKLLCVSLLQSRFDNRYNVFYRSLNKCIENKFQRAQNKIVMFITGIDCRTQELVELYLFHILRMLNF